MSLDTNDLLPGYHLTVCTDLDGQQTLCLQCSRVSRLLSGQTHAQ